MYPYGFPSRGVFRTTPYKVNKSSRPQIIGHDTRFCEWCTKEIYDYHKGENCHYCHKRVGVKVRAPDGCEWCPNCAVGAIKSIHSCCVLCGYITNLGHKKQEAFDRSQRLQQAMKQKLRFELKKLEDEARDGSGPISRELGGTLGSFHELGGTLGSSQEHGGSLGSSQEPGGSLGSSHELGGSLGSSHEHGGSLGSSHELGGSLGSHELDELLGPSDEFGSTDRITGEIDSDLILMASDDENPTRDTDGI